MRILHTADKIAETMEKDYAHRSWRLKKVGEIVKIIEKKQAKYSKRAAAAGSFVKRTKGHTFAVRIDPKDPNKTNFYIKQAKIIGKGGFKTVYPLINYETGEAEFALSVQKADLKRRHNIDYPHTGAKIMKTVSESKNTMKAEIFYENGVTRESNGTLIDVNKDGASYLVTKLYQGKFSNLINKNDVPFNKKLMLFSKILESVADMHAKQIVHMDLKGANVLYKYKNDQIKIKLIDFDLSQSFKDRMATTRFAGTLHYSAPEALAHSIILYPEKLDSWSLGIMLYILCEGKPVFFKEQKNASKKTWDHIVLNGTRDLPFNKLSQDNPLREVIEGLLRENPAERMSVTVAKEAVEKHLLSLITDGY